MSSVPFTRVRLIFEWAGNGFRHCAAKPLHYDQAMKDWRERISVNPSILSRPAVCQRHANHGVRSARNLAAGIKRDEIIASYPGWTEADLDAALACAAELAREGAVALPLEIGA